MLTETTFLISYKILVNGNSIDRNNDFRFLT